MILYVQGGLVTAQYAPYYKYGASAMSMNGAAHRAATISTNTNSSFDECASFNTQ